MDRHVSAFYLASDFGEEADHIGDGSYRPSRHFSRIAGQVFADATGEPLKPTR